MCLQLRTSLGRARRKQAGIRRDIATSWSLCPEHPSPGAGRSRAHIHPPAALSSAQDGWQVPVNAPGSRGLHDNPVPWIFLPQTGGHGDLVPTHPLVQGAIPFAGHARLSHRCCHCLRAISHPDPSLGSLSFPTSLMQMPGGKQSHVAAVTSRPFGTGSRGLQHLEALSSPTCAARGVSLPLFGLCSGDSHRNCLTISGFQDCNHSCQLWKCAENVVKH